MNQTQKSISTVFVLSFLFTFSGFTQSLQHLVIWGTTTDKTEILEKIDNYDWSKTLVFMATEFIRSDQLK